MPHQCVRCGTFYQDGASEILKGCSCGARLFFYIKKEKLEKIEKAKEPDVVSTLSEQQKDQIEKDVFDMVGADPDKGDPVVLDLESIHVKKPGQYELDLVHLFKGEPVIFKLEEGKYVIDVVETFKKFKDKKSK